MLTLSLCVGFHCQLSCVVERGPSYESYVRTKTPWSFILRVVEGPHDGRGPEDIGWLRVDVVKDPPVLWKKVYIVDEAAMEEEVREDLKQVPFLFPSTISREVEEGQFEDRRSFGFFWERGNTLG